MRIIIICFIIFSSNTLQAHDIKNEKVHFSGLAQIEARYNKDFDEFNTSDFAVDELSFALEAKAHKWVTGMISFLYEQDVTPLEIDEAMITIGQQAPVYLTIGQMYVPFANLESHMVSDPLTLALGEIRGQAFLLGAKAGGFYSRFYAFNDRDQKDAENLINHHGINLGFTKEAEIYSFDIGMSYINDISHAYGLGFVNEDHVGGLAAYFILNAGSVNFIAEYVTTLNEFNPAYLEFNGVGAEPKAWNAELGYTLPIAGKETTFAVGYQGLEEAGMGLELPERRYLATASVGIFDNTKLSLEYAFSQDYDVADGGTGKNAHSAILQLAVAF